MASTIFNSPTGISALTPISNGAALELESQLVRETQQQLRQTVSEISELAQLPIGLEEFVNGFLPRVSSAMFATGVGVWRFKNEWQLIGNLSLPIELIAGGINEDEPLVQINGINKSTRRPSLPHQRLLDRVAQERQPILVPPHGVSNSSDRPSNPIDQTIILAPAPFESGQESYWLEVISRPFDGPATQRGYLRFVAQMADLFAEHLKSSRLRILERDQALFWECGKLIDEISGTLRRQL